MALDPLVPGPARHRAVRQMFDRIAPRYDLVNRVMTFGLDRHWRRLAVGALGLRRGALVVDVACGTADFGRELRRAGHRGIGFDVSEGMLRAASASVPLVLADALRLPVTDGAAHGATCGFALRNVDDVAGLLAELARVLRPGGRLALLEVAEPTAAVSKALHRVYFHRVVPLVGAALSDGAAYRYLPASAARLPGHRGLEAMVLTAGFADHRRRLLAHGAAQLVTATRA